MNKIVMIIALALVFNMNANAKTNWVDPNTKTNWIMENSYFIDCREILFNGIGEDGLKTIEMWDCEHQENLQRKKWSGKWNSSLILYEN